MNNIKYKIHYYIKSKIIENNSPYCIPLELKTYLYDLLIEIENTIK